MKSWALKVLVVEWIHFTLFGIILPTIKLKVCTAGALMNSATKKYMGPSSQGFTVTRSGFRVGS